MKRKIIYPTLVLALIGSLNVLDSAKHRRHPVQAQAAYLIPQKRQPIIENFSLENKLKSEVLVQSQNTPYHDLIRKASEKYNLPFNILDSLIFQESSYNTNAISSKGAEGLTQLMPGTARDLGITDTLNPEESIDAGARYLKRMFKMFGKSPKPIEEQWKFALAAYNAGPGNVIEAQRIAKSNGLNPNLWESIDDFMPKEETRDYVERISARSHLNSFYSKN